MSRGEITLPRVLVLGQGQELTRKNLGARRNLEKKYKNPLTNKIECAIIKTQKGRNGETEWCDPRESIRPVPMNRPQGVRICGI